MKKPHQPGMVAIGGYWRVRDPDTGQKFAHPYFTQVKAQFHGYLVKQGRKIPWNFDEWFDGLICESTPQSCDDIPDTPPTEDLTLRKMAKEFTASAIEWARNGFPLVDWEEFKRRRDICAGTPDTERCPNFHPGSRFTLARCGKCGCTKLKLTWATEHCPIQKW